MTRKVPILQAISINDIVSTNVIDLIEKCRKINHRKTNESFSKMNFFRITDYKENINENPLIDSIVC